MFTVPDISLRDYLRLQILRTKDPPCIPEYDEFLIKVWDFFALRVAAEDGFEKNKHVAVSKRGPLPVPWRVIQDALQIGGPPEQMISLIAKRRYNDVNSVISNLRKVLTCVRQKVALGRVQQVDAHCLRWLTRQPGRSAAEKGGSKQEILGVVRVENYNTLENRVLKDFLLRCLALATMYLRRYEKAHKDHVNIKAVSRFKNLCVAGLALPEMDKVLDIREFPQPNYVLQQDRLYSKIWQSYCDIMRQEDVAERLWNRREEIDELYAKCEEKMDLHCSPRALYDTLLWICELDGRGDIFENPIWDNEEGSRDIVLPDPSEADINVGDVMIVDFTCPWDARDELVYPSSHANARPFLQNKHRPSLEPGTVVSVQEILRTRNPGQLTDYFRQLYGLLKGDRWVVLVPDNWEPMWLESVLRANVLSRDRVFLLWRSVAAALGVAEHIKFQEGDELFVSDGYSKTRRDNVLIRFMRDETTGRIIPQRASPRLHGKGSRTDDPRFWFCERYDDCSSARLYGKTARLVITTGVPSISFAHQMSGLCKHGGESILTEGVCRYIRERAQNNSSYFDEIDELSLVVQNDKEEVLFLPLIEHQECWPGGKLYTGSQIFGGSMDVGSDSALINLLEGVPDDAAPLKQLEITIKEDLLQKSEMIFSAEIMPGQGLASLWLSADFLKDKKCLDLAKMCDSKFSKLRIEQELERHFPPNMPYVEASDNLWQDAKLELGPYLANGRLTVREKGAFYKPRDYYDANISLAQNDLWGHVRTGRVFDEAKMSPIDKLKRENVFGNNPENSIPSDDFDFAGLFARLAKDYESGSDVIRLMAWTYQHDNPLYEKARKRLYSRYVSSHDNLSAEETSFCSNSFRDGDVRISNLVAEALRRIIKGIHKDDDYRLVYNLLQFHPTAAKDLSTELCTEAFLTIVNDRFVEDAFYEYTRFGRRWGGKGATMRLGFMVKALLFLLHRRRYDAAFLGDLKEWKPNGFFGKMIPHDTPAKATHDATREAVVAYVNGRGKLKGIPSS